MKPLIVLAVSILCATTGFGVVAADSPSISAFLANAWICLDRDIPEDTKDWNLEVARKELKITLERMGRWSQVLEAAVPASERSKDPSHRSSFRRQARDIVTKLEADAKIVATFGKKGVPSLNTEVSQDLLSRALEELSSIRKRIETNAEEDGEPGATDNPDDAQRLREDH